MRKVILICLLILFTSITVSAHGDDAHAAIEFTSLRTVSGTVSLTAKAKGFPSNLSSLYKGRDSAVNLSPEGKLIRVSGSYDGTTSVRVEETGRHDASYVFLLPVIRSVIEAMRDSSFKDSEGTSSVRAVFDGLVTSSGSLNSVVGGTTNVHVVRDLSVGKITAIRKGNRAVVRGNFLKPGTSAKGRFKLVFTP